MSGFGPCCRISDASIRCRTIGLKYDAPRTGRHDRLRVLGLSAEAHTRLPQPGPIRPTHHPHDQSRRRVPIRPLARPSAGSRGVSVVAGCRGGGGEWSDSGRTNHRGVGGLDGDLVADRGPAAGRNRPASGRRAATRRGVDARRGHGTLRQPADLSVPRRLRHWPRDPAIRSAPTHGPAYPAGGRHEPAPSDCRLHAGVRGPEHVDIEYRHGDHDVADRCERAQDAQRQEAQQRRRCAGGRAERGGPIRHRAGVGHRLCVLYRWDRDLDRHAAEPDPRRFSAQPIRDRAEHGAMADRGSAVGRDPAAAHLAVSDACGVSGVQRATPLRPRRDQGRTGRVGTDGPRRARREHGVPVDGRGVDTAAADRGLDGPDRADRRDDCDGRGVGPLHPAGESGGRWTGIRPSGCLGTS